MSSQPLSTLARLYHAQIVAIKIQFDKGERDAAKNRRFELLRKPEVPRGVRVRAYWVISLCIDNIDHAEEFLERAMRLCAEMEEVEDGDESKGLGRDTQWMIDRLGPTSRYPAPQTVPSKTSNSPQKRSLPNRGGRKEGTSPAGADASRKVSEGSDSTV